jgi:hypothetical protein
MSDYNDDFFGAEFDLDVANLPDQGDARTFEPIPAGTVAQAMLTQMAAEISPQGYKQLAYKVQIIEGEFENRLIWGQLRLGSPNEAARAYAQRALDGILTALEGARGTRRTTNPEELLHLPMTITIGINEYNGKRRNEVKHWAPPGGAPAAAKKQTKIPAAAPAPAAAAPAGGAKKKAPWDR